MDTPPLCPACNISHFGLEDPSRRRISLGAQASEAKYKCNKQTKGIVKYLGQTVAPPTYQSITSISSCAPFAERSFFSRLIAGRPASITCTGDDAAGGFWTTLEPCWRC